MINKIELFEKFSIIKFNSSNDIFQGENDDILCNQSNNSILCYNSTYTNKNLGINTTIKPFDLLIGQDYSEMNSIINSTLLYFNKDLGLNNYNKDNNKAISYKFKIKKTRMKRAKQSFNKIGKKIFTIKKLMKFKTLLLKKIN